MVTHKREAKLFKVVLRTHKVVVMPYKDPQVMQMVMKLSKVQHREAKLSKSLLLMQEDEKLPHHD